MKTRGGTRPTPNARREKKAKREENNSPPLKNQRQNIVYSPLPKHELNGKRTNCLCHQKLLRWKKTACLAGVMGARAPPQPKNMVIGFFPRLPVEDERLGWKSRPPLETKRAGLRKSRKNFVFAFHIVWKGYLGQNNTFVKIKIYEKEKFCLAQKSPNLVQRKKEYVWK